MAWKVLRSFRFKLLSGTLLLLSLLLISMGLFEYTSMQRYLYHSAATHLKDQVHAIGPQVWNQVSEDSTTAQSSLAKLLDHDVTLALVSPDGTLQPINRDERHQRPVPTLTPGQYQVLFTPGSKPDWSGIALGKDGRREMVVLQRFNSPEKAVYLVQASSSLKPAADILHESLTTYGLGALATLLLGAITFRFLIHRMLSPLSKMVQSLEKMDAGTLQNRLAPQETDELNRLAHSFNALLARLETAFNREKEARETLRRFVADASHELRTPLTALHGFLEVLLLGAVENPEQRHFALQSMHLESERLIKLVNDLLFLARFDRQATLTKEKTCLADVLKEMEPELYLLAKERSVKLKIHDPGYLFCARPHLKQVVLNLFQNAVHYTDPLTGKIELSLAKSAGDLLVLEVRDNGCGISAGDLPHVFERFYRGEKSRNRKQGGTGLGLAIVKSIVEAHRGRVSVESVLEQGAVFRVELPI